MADDPYSVTVTNPGGCTATTNTVMQSNTATPMATLSSSGQITCTNRTVTLTASGGNTYAFSPEATPNGNTATVSSDGLYSVTVTGANSCTATQTTQISSNTTAPNATLSNSSQITCANRTIILTAGGGGTYAFSAGATPNGNTAAVSNEGTYTVTVTNTTNGCSATATTTVTSNTTAPNPTLANNGPITPNQPTVTLTAGGGNSYAFSSGASQQDAGNTATVGII